MNEKDLQRIIYYDSQDVTMLAASELTEYSKLLYKLCADLKREIATLRDGRRVRKGATR